MNGTKSDIGRGLAVEPIKFDAIQNPDDAWTQIAHPTIYKNGVFYCAGVTGFTKTKQYGDIRDPMIDRSRAKSSIDYEAVGPTKL